MLLYEDNDLSALAGRGDEEVLAVVEQLLLSSEYSTYKTATARFWP